LGGRLRKLLALVVIVGAIPLGASAAEFRSCWVAEVIDPVTFDTRIVTRCRIAGGGTADYASDSSVPAVLYPNLGTDVDGLCWFYTSAVTQYIIITNYADGSADIAFVPDPSAGGGIMVVGPNLSRCTTEPTPVSDPATDAWDYVMSYIHDPPTPELNPQPGQGVTGLATYVGVDVPEPHETTLSSGFTTIEIEITVDTVIVTWGDGHTSTYPADPDVLAGYPDGSATHIYEVKDSEGVDLTVEYDWHARWRTTGGTWATLPVPNTTTTINYPIAEVVSRLNN
jgi:hypothetical protein